MLESVESIFHLAFDQSDMIERSPLSLAHVTTEQAFSYQQQVQQLLDDTLEEYDNQVTACNSGKNPLHDKWQWKPLKTYEDLSVYKERQPTHPELNSFSNSTSRASNVSASAYSNASVTEQPTMAVTMAAYTPEMTQSTSSAAVTGSSSIASMVVMGHIDGSLNDAMYGLLATDSVELQLRLRYMVDPDVLNTAIISCIQTPSAAEPFHFIGLQWVVRGETSRVNSSSRRLRDFMLVVASGVVRHKVPGRTEVQEIGYSLCQSVPMQECETRGHTRGWLSTCSLFTPTEGSSARLDVFSRGYADFKGKMQDYQASTMMNSLMLAGVAQAASCGQSKKLSWLLNFQGAAAEFRQMQPEAKSASNCCGICDRKFGVLNSVASCTLCQLKLCSRCRVSRELSFVKRQDVVSSTIQSRSCDEGHQASRQVQCRTVLLCKSCKMNAGHMDASVMARREVEAAYSSNGTSQASLVSNVQNPSRTSLSNSQSGSELSYSGEGTAQSRFWTSGTDTANLQGRKGTSTLGDPRNDIHDVVKTKVRLDRLDSGETSFSDSATRLDCSFASTLPSPRDRDSSQDEFSTELTKFTYQSRQQQHQIQYTVVDPEIMYTSSRQPNANAGRHQAQLMRRMQELQKSADSVYQFTSRMSANTCYQYEHFAPVGSKISISELE